jgi:FkbM family methyltransferase
MIKKLKPYCTKAVESQKLQFTFIDVGSRNGVLELASFAPYTDVYGFEPNAEEYKKLVSGTSDLELKFGVKSPHYKSLKYSPVALGNREGKTDFFITHGPGAAGVQEPDLESLGQIRWKGKSYSRSLGQDIFSAKKVEVDMTTLDAFAKENQIKKVDYLKIDVEGFEYEVLEGAKALLKDTGVIKVETCFIPFRKNQKLFSDIDILLRNSGFGLLNYEIDNNQVGYKYRKKPVEYVPAHFKDPLGSPLQCDAIYVNRGLKDEDSFLRQALVLVEKNYLDEALYILRKFTQYKDEIFFEQLERIQTFSRENNFGAKRRAYYYIDKIVSSLGKLNAF